MKQKFVVGTLAVVFLAALGWMFEKPLLAQVRAALTQNVDEPARNPFQQSFFSYLTNCSAGGKFCNFNYDAVPAGKRLVITHVSGYIDISNGMLPNCNVESNFGGNQYAEAFFTGVRGPVSATSTRIFLNQDLQMYFGAGEVPHGFCGLVSTSDTFAGGGEMVLSGYMITL